MIVNNSITVYHKSIDENTRLEKWTRYNYGEVWFFKRNKSIINKGYDNANVVDIRISYEQNSGLDVSKFAFGDIVVPGTIDIDITTQSDLKTYDIYNIISINNNNFGNNPHIHIGGE